MRQVVRPGVSDADLKEMLYDLAEYTLCRRDHQNQAENVSDRWFGMVQKHCDDEDDRGSDTSDDEDDDRDDGASSTGSSGSDKSDDDDSDNAQELRRRFDELETLQREFEELLQRQRESLQDRVSRSAIVRQARQPQENRRLDNEISRHSTARERRDQEDPLRKNEQAQREAEYLVAQRTREAVREQRRRDRAEQAKREEFQRQAQARREAEEKAKAEAEEKAAAAEAERLRKEQEPEKARLDRERQAKEKKQQQQQSRNPSWETAWLRYEAAWAAITPTITNTSTPVGTDIRKSQIWPTKSGSFASCSEEDVRAFFRCQPGDVNRRNLRRQALRWHPDRAARLFACVADELVVGEVLRTVTMISQVVIGVMGVTAR